VITSVSPQLQLDSLEGMGAASEQNREIDYNDLVWGEEYSDDDLAEFFIKPSDALRSDDSSSSDEDEEDQESSKKRSKKSQKKNKKKCNRKRRASNEKKSKKD
jgi:hypothetical protein